MSKSRSVGTGKLCEKSHTHKSRDLIVYNIDKVLQNIHFLGNVRFERSCVTV